MIAVGSRRIHKAFSVNLAGERKPINVVYRLLLPELIEFDFEEGTRRYELFAIVVNTREEETVYLIGDEVFT